MSAHRADDFQLDALIVGGGVAGLWLLNEATRRGFSVLLVENRALGHGQTIASQGIIHGGLKYTLKGLLTRSASEIRGMPELWTACLEGTAQPDLRGTVMRARHCHLWRTRTLRSRVAMIGAKAGLHVKPVALGDDERPEALRGIDGPVARLDEPVLEPASLLNHLATPHFGRIVKVRGEHGVRFDSAREGACRITLAADGDNEVIVRPRTIVLCAGAGNAHLRARANLPDGAQQQRPLHMVAARGSMPPLNGHCVDGAATRITVTSTRDVDGQTIWQIGGQLAERGVQMESSQLIAFAKQELREVLPGVNLDGARWMTYRVDRAEASSGGNRPESVSVLREGAIITAWPTKLALAPVLAQRVIEHMGEGIVSRSGIDEALRHWPRPLVADPPWAGGEWID